MSRKKRLVRSALTVLIVFVFAAAGELLLSAVPQLFLFGSDCPQRELTELTPDSTAPATDDGFTCFSGFTFAMYPLSARAGTVSFDISIPDATEPVTVPVTVCYSYPGEEECLYPTQEKRVIADKEPVRYSLAIPSGHKAAYISFSIPEPKSFVNFSNLTVNERAKSGFMLARFIFLALVGFAAVFAARFRRTVYDPHRRSHLAFAAALVVLCAATAVISAVFFTSGTVKNTVYPLENSIESYQPYIQQFDAFQKGQLHLDCKVPPELLALDNPYDKASRDGLYYLWDRALYDGKYYSYFGIVPLLTVYYPFYLITGALPADRVVMGIFAVMTAVFFPLAVLSFVRLFDKKVTIPVLGLGVYSALFSSQVFLFLRGRSPFYFIALMAATAFISLFAWLTITAFSVKRKPLHLPLMALAGLAFGLAFLSRINTAFPAAFMILFVIIYNFVTSIKGGKKKFGSFMADCICLGAPVAACVGFALAFNYMRFGSPFEFGTTYQLTVSDVSQNKLYAAGIAPALYHYFFQLPRSDGSFPFISLGYKRLEDYGRAFTYTDSNIGLFTVPCSIGLPLSLSCISKRCKFREYGLLITGAVSLFVTAYLDFCLGGVIFRYVGDITAAATFISTAVFFSILDTVRASKRIPKVVSGILTGLVCLFFAASILYSAALALSHSFNLLTPNAEIYSACLRFFFPFG